MLYFFRLWTGTTHWFSFLARVPIRVGDGSKFPIRFLFTHHAKISYRSLIIHETHVNIELIKAICPTPKLSTDNAIVVTKSNQHAGQQFLHQYDLDHQSYIIIHPTTGGGNRPWHPLSYAAFINIVCKATHYTIILTGATASDSQINEHIFSSIDQQYHQRVIQASGRTPMGTLKYLIQHSRMVIGTDTGPTHMASALNVPVLCISPTKFVSPLRWGPWMTINRISINTDTCPLSCFPYTCNKQYCLDALTPQQVFNDFQACLAIDTYDHEETMHHWLYRSLKLLIIVDQHTLDQGQQLAALAHAHSMSAWVASFDKCDQTIPLNSHWQLSSSIIKYDTTLVCHFIPLSSPLVTLTRIRCSLKMYAPPIFISNPDDTKYTQHFGQYLMSMCV